MSKVRENLKILFGQEKLGTFRKISTKLKKKSRKLIFVKSDFFFACLSKYVKKIGR
jgi:hypothetical protein